MRHILLILILAMTSSTVMFAGGPWPQLKNKGYFKLSEWWTVFDEHYTDVGLKDPNVTSGIFNTFIYGEFGISDRLTSIVNASIFSRNYMNNLRSITTNDIIVEGEALNSLGDIDLGLKYSLTKPGAGFPVSVSLILGIPSGTNSGGKLNNLQTGDGEFNQILQIDVGKGFKIGAIPGYASVYTGFNNRSNDFSEEFRLGAEVGFGFIEQKLWLTGRLHVIESFKNGSTAATITSSSIFANNTEFVSLGVEANFYITKNMGISGGIANALSGEIIAAAPSYSVGVFFDMSK